MSERIVNNKVLVDKDEYNELLKIKEKHEENCKLIDSLEEDLNKLANAGMANTISKTSEGVETHV